MPHYIVSHHARQRFEERFPELAALTSSEQERCRWLAGQVRHGRPAGEQFGLDLLLRCCVRHAGVETEFFAPVVPLGGDRWLVRTVLDAEQAAHNLQARSALLRERWRRTKGFDRRRRRRPRQGAPGADNRGRHKPPRAREPATAAAEPIGLSRARDRACQQELQQRTSTAQ
ncbi:MAG: hypothetical protein RMM29_00495 [Planctomycetota bacterium]|nr:hypothetical protein [Planctomycetota bacterium]MCX8039069.1 hypothetical protein [Planctomycetota bacterium]MDW8372114.1 hypothetical protein [Planctomycetota bacterium]